jgi:hypothetical protein
MVGVCMLPPVPVYHALVLQQNPIHLTGGGQHPMDHLVPSGCGVSFSYFLNSPHYLSANLFDFTIFTPCSWLALPLQQQEQQQ